MRRVLKQRSVKAGLPPGSLVHIGELRSKATAITVLDYDEAHCSEHRINAASECVTFRQSPSCTWINVEGVHDSEVLKAMGECYGFHPLVLEDVMNTDQRPKFEDYSEYLYIVLKMLRYDEKARLVVTEQISLILGPNFVFSFQEGVEGDVFGPIRERLKNEKSKVRKMGADYLVYSMMDAVVDSYFATLENIGDDIEVLEERVVNSASGATLRDIHHLKKEMLFLRRAVWPLREVIGALARGESPLVKDPTRVYLRDVYDHTVQVMDTVETFREMTSGMLDIYLSSVSNRLNSVMKVLTIIATIFMPLTFIAGVYGMNFKYFPELQWRYGYALFWGVNVVIAAVMLIFFRTKKWI